MVEPTVPILLLACIVHAVRQNLFDLLLFGGSAALIVADSQWAWRRGGALGSAALDEAFGGRRHIWWQAVVVAVAAGIIAAFQRDSVGIRAVFYVAAAAALTVVAVSSGREVADAGGQRSPAGWQVWAVIGVIASLWELTSFSFQQADPTKGSAHPISDVTHPAASDLIGPLLDGWVGRAVFLLLWGAAGMWLLRRIYHGPAPTPHDGADEKAPVPR